MDVGRARYPDRDAFVAARVDVARILDRHLRVRGVQAADVLVRKTVLRSDEHLPQRPFTHVDLRYLRRPRGETLTRPLSPRAPRAFARAPLPPREPTHRRPTPGSACACGRDCTARGP